jgi:hypothetical protein
MATAAAAGAAALGGGPGGAAQQRNRVREAIGLKPEVLAHDAGHVSSGIGFYSSGGTTTLATWTTATMTRSTATSSHASIVSFVLTSSRWSLAMPSSSSLRTSTTRRP